MKIRPWPPVLYGPMRFRGYDNPRGQETGRKHAWRTGQFTVGQTYPVRSSSVEMYDAPDEWTAGVGNCFPDANFTDDRGKPAWELLMYFDHV